MTKVFINLKSRAGYGVPVLTLMICLTGMTMYSGVTDAQMIGSKEREEKQEERKTKQVAAMSEQVYKKLTEAQEAIEAKQYNDGLEMLSELLQRRGLSAYEKAQVHNYFAYTYFTLERYKDAIRAYENVLKQEDIPEGLILNSTYTLAQLYFIEEDYNRAIELINEWFTMSAEPTINAYMLLGQAYYQLEKFKESLDPLKKAYALVKSRGEEPRENLLLLLQAAYINLGDYKNLIVVLKEMVELYPKSQYWLSIANAYSELKQLKKQMSIYEMLYENDALERGNQKLNLANLYLLHEVPYKAAKVLDKGINSGEIEDEVRNLRLLSQAWIQSQESEKSLGPLKKAADLTKDGELDVRLGQAYINLNRYEEAIDALKTGIKKGKIKRLDQAYVMLGMAEFELKNFSSAIKSFAQAARLAKDKSSERSAQQWRDYAQTEMDREKQLQQSLQNRRG